MKLPVCQNSLGKFCKHSGWAVALLLSACVGNDMSDLEQYVAEIKSQKNIVPPPLPPFPPEEVYLYPYDEGMAKDPFAPLEETKRADEQKIPLEKADRPECKPPDLYRNPEPLEQFPIDSLNMMGTLAIGSEIWGLIKTPPPEELIHRVQVNNYIGKNSGKITYIGDDRIDLTEKVDDGTGCFVEKQSSLQIKP